MIMMMMMMMMMMMKVAVKVAMVVMTITSRLLEFATTRRPWYRYSRHDCRMVSCFSLTVLVSGCWLQSLQRSPEGLGPLQPPPL